MTRSDHWALRSGLRRVVAFNWPKYAVAGVAFVLAGISAFSKSGLVQLVSILLFLGLAYGIVVSLLATWWVYDHCARRLYTEIAAAGGYGKRWVLVHAGFDESMGRLDQLLGQRERTIDVGPSSDSSPSLRRAHRLIGRTGEPYRKDDLEIIGLDAAILLFGIHEIADDSTCVRLLSDLKHSIPGAGRIVIVEHCINAANVAAFGPAAWHFSTESRWRKAAADANLTVTASKRVAAFVTVLTMS
jgi:hypothetical protein